MVVNFKQVIQDKSAQIAYRQEGGAKQHRMCAICHKNLTMVHDIIT